MRKHWRSGLAGLLLAGGIFCAAPAAAELTELAVVDSVTAPAQVGLRLSSFHGDGFWDAGRKLANQSNSLREERFSVFARTTLVKGLFVGLVAPTLRREIDQATPGSLDAEGFGLGDAEIELGWLDQHWRWRFRPGAQMLWKTPSGRANLGLEDVDRGNPTSVPFGTGGHDLDFWGGSLFDGGPLVLGVALGYRKRFATDVAYVFNSTFTTSTRPRERLQLKVQLEANAKNKVYFELGFESFKEILLLDSRRSSFGQNRSWGSWLELGLRLPTGWGDVSLSYSLPAIGRLYPTLPPEQFQEREPLLGQRLSTEVRWLFLRPRDQTRRPGTARETDSEAAVEAAP